LETCFIPKQLKEQRQREMELTGGELREREVRGLYIRIVNVTQIAAAAEGDDRRR
jgi:hypothetical protein